MATTKQRAAGSRNGARQPKQQAERFARESRKKIDAQDLRFMELQKFLWNPLIDYWFRMEVEGWENIPEPPALLVGIHSNAPFVWDAWTIGVHWWRRFGR